MVFGKKKETNEEKKARLLKELEQTEKEEFEAQARNVEAQISNMGNEPKGNGVKIDNMLAELETSFGNVFPELGPSAHAHYERVLLLAILEELRLLRGGGK